MAKETTIIFLYDTELLQREEDDPNSAILYFYPTWVSDQQKTALCGQLMGSVRCLKSILSIPKIVSLQTGKFFIIENDRYTLAVGSDRNIPDWLLENRAKLIYSLVNFYHKDFVHLASIYQNDAFSAKLYHMFDTYLKLMLFSGNIFSQISMLELSKSGNNICKQANNFLELCRDLPNSLGGVVLYHNKIVSTQLSAPTTKKIVLADPYRIKSPAEIVQTNFDLPFGHQLLQVYITNKEFCSLLETSIANRCILAKTKLKKNDFPENCTAESVETPDTQNGSLSLLKRDTSLLFTAVPEEDSANTNRNVCDNANEFPVGLRKNGQRRSRPTSLKLKSHNFDLNETKLNSLPSFCSQSSVASTPMTELKLFVHDQSLDLADKIKLDAEHFEQELEKDVQNTSKHNFKDSKSSNTFSVDLSKMFFQSLQRRNVFRRYASLMELPQLLSSISSNQNQYSNQTCKHSVLSKKNSKLKRSNTIHDPVSPMFRQGSLLAASQYYLKEAVKNGLLKDDKNSSEDCIDFLTGSGVKKRDLSQSHPQTMSKEHRKSLTLPLKPLNPSETCVNQRKYSLGVQLTPLLNKLSVLTLEKTAVSEKEVNLRTSYGVTPSKRSLELPVKSRNTDDENTLERCAMFVCGHQDVVLALLLQVECSKDKETIDKLRDLCAEQLPKLGSQLNSCMQTFGKTKTSPQHTEPYSFITMDSDWDAVQRGGPWDNVDLKNLSTLYGDFGLHRDVTEIYLRNPDSVLYGHNSGLSHAFYHETVPAAKGLLTPNDPIGTIKNKARKRLERDHSIELL